MANQPVFRGDVSAAGGILLPVEQGEILTNGLLQENGALSIAGDAKTTDKRKTTFPIWLGQPTAGPVGEAGSKPATGAEFGSTELNVKKFASIVLFTDEQIDDVQSGDMDVLVDGGVRSALRDSIDAHVLGIDSGTTIGSPVFDSFLRHAAPDTTNTVDLDLVAADGLQTAVSAAMGLLEGRGYGDPSQMGIVLAHGFQKSIRDAKVGTSGLGRLYAQTDDPLYGLDRAISTNLQNAATAATAAIATATPLAFVVYKPNLHVRIRTDVRVKVADTGTVTDQGSVARNLFQEDLIAVRYETRLAFMVHDKARAVVALAPVT